MKRTLSVLGFSLLALTANAVEYSPPFMQLELDRALPNIDFAPVERDVPDARAPYDQLAIDRALPDLQLPSQGAQFAEGPSTGDTLTDATATDEPSFESPFANDHNFIAPAQ